MKTTVLEVSKWRSGRCRSLQGSTLKPRSSVHTEKRRGKRTERRGDNDDDDDDDDAMVVLPLQNCLFIQYIELLLSSRSPSRREKSPVSIGLSALERMRCIPTGMPRWEPNLLN
ncbi:hypothetical protein PUN28_011793 [Cardiocondyla obscurior]|uniref:Uncharacterized protein n=1 Tax=Cardiocondyla obscurior TaxID=286306 RepID=A0AAW2FI53_9HYME